MSKAAYLFGYNPDLQITLHRCLDEWAHRMQDEFDDKGKIACSQDQGWTCHSKHVEVGDEAFLFRQGDFLERGIIGHGFVVHPLFEDTAYKTDSRYRRAPIEWDAFKIYGRPLIGIDILQRIGISSPRCPGLQIERRAAKALRAIWNRNEVKRA